MTKPRHNGQYLSDLSSTWPFELIVFMDLCINVKCEYKIMLVQLLLLVQIRSKLVEPIRDQPYDRSLRRAVDEMNRHAVCYAISSLFKIRF